jgi:MoxR-like ATPase
LAQSIRWQPSQVIPKAPTKTKVPAKTTAKTKPVTKENISIMEGFSRIQCTVDLLPQDILGYNRFLGHSGELIFN